jgi:hypothetical protein
MPRAGAGAACGKSPLARKPAVAKLLDRDVLAGQSNGAKKAHSRSFPARQGLVLEVRINHARLLGADLVVKRKLGRGRADVVHQTDGHHDFALDAGRQVLHVDETRRVNHCSMCSCVGS